MSIKKTTLAASLSVVIGLGMVGQAHAGVYAGAGLEIQDLQITFDPTTVPNPEYDPALPDGPDNSPTIPSNVVTGYDFTVENSSSLNNADATGNLTNSCNQGPGTNTCSETAPVLTTDAANAPGGTVNRDDGGANNWDFFGPGSDEYANADAEILNATLANAVPTDTLQISETEVQTEGNAQADSSISSTTGFVFTFEVTDSGELTLVFDADVELLAEIDAPEPPKLASASASGGVTATFTLNQTIDFAGGTLDKVEWAPDGTTVNNCISDTLTCTEDADGENLQANASVTAVNSDLLPPGFPNGNPSSASTSWDGVLGDAFDQFGITISGLDAGIWSLELIATTNNDVNYSTIAVPEPGMLLLLASGLIGVGATRRRKVRKA